MWPPALQGVIFCVRRPPGRALEFAVSASRNTSTNDFFYLVCIFPLVRKFVISTPLFEVVFAFNDYIYLIVVYIYIFRWLLVASE